MRKCARCDYEYDDAYDGCPQCARAVYPVASQVPPVPVSQTPAAAPATKNWAADVGLMLGLLSVVFYFVGMLPIAAVVFSGIGLSKVRTTGRGKVVAWIGLVLGCLYTLMYLREYGHLG